MDEVQQAPLKSFVITACDGRQVVVVATHYLINEFGYLHFYGQDGSVVATFKLWYHVVTT